MLKISSPGHEWDRVSPGLFGAPGPLYYPPRRVRGRETSSFVSAARAGAGRRYSSLTTRTTLRARRESVLRKFITRAVRVKDNNDKKYVGKKNIIIIIKNLPRPNQFLRARCRRPGFDRVVNQVMPGPPSFDRTNGGAVVCAQSVCPMVVVVALVYDRGKKKFGWRKTSACPLIYFIESGFIVLQCAYQ